MSLSVVFSDKIGQLLPKDERERKNKRLTDLAKKYSHPSRSTKPLAGNQSQSPLAGTFKSGFTPLSPFVAGRAGISKRRLHTYQRKRFYGFPSAEPSKLGSLAAAGEDPYNEDFEDLLTGKSIGFGSSGELNNPIDPLYQKDRCEKMSEIPKTRGPIPIQGDVGGYWSLIKRSGNCLNLVSAWLHWWDALFESKYTKVVEKRLRPEHMMKVLWSFHKRPRNLRDEDAALGKVEFRFNEAAKRIKLRIQNGHCNPWKGVVERPTFWSGHTAPEFLGGPPVLSIATQILYPHAIWLTMVEKHTHPEGDSEPFYENERLPELGWSLESHMWVGQPLPLSMPGFNAGGPGLPEMGFVKSDFFNEKNVDYNSSTLIPLKDLIPLPREKDPFCNPMFFPMPITWFKDLQRIDKWEYSVKKFGRDTARMGPLVSGTVIYLDTGEWDLTKVVRFINLKEKINILKVPEQELMSMTDGQKQAVRMEISRQQKALSIREAAEGWQTKFDEYVASDASKPAPDIVDTCPCNLKRYEEIKKFFFANRSHNQLAFDTMDFELPEPTLLRCILDLGGLAITPAELRAFLHFCNVKKELFEYQPFPGVGMLFKIPDGWPSPITPPPRIERTGRAGKIDMHNIRRVFRLDAFRTGIYKWHH